MGSVLRALKKSIASMENTVDPVIHVVTMAVADAEKATRESLDAEVVAQAIGTEAAAPQAAIAAPAPAPVESPPSAPAVWPKLGRPETQPQLELSACLETTPRPAPAPRGKGAPRAAVVAKPQAKIPPEVHTPVEIPSRTTVQVVKTPGCSTGQTVPSAQPLRVSPVLLAHYSPTCAAVEQLRQLRTSLLNLVHGGSVRCMITSALPREGKSVTAANLAYLFTEFSHKRTLLIDADLHRGQIGELFGLRAGPGLAELLAGTSIAADVIRRGPRENLDIVPAGQANPNLIGELLSGKSAQGAVRDLLRGYDHVIIDSPPAQSLADASIVGQWVDLALLAVRVRKTPRQVVLQTVQTLQAAGVRLAGVVALDDDASSRKYAG